MTSSRYVDYDNKSDMVDIDEMINIYGEQIELLSNHLLKGGVAYHLFFKDHIWFPFLHQLGILDDRYVSEKVEEGSRMCCTLMDKLFIVDVDGSLKRCQKLRGAELGHYSEYNFSNLIAEDNKSGSLSACNNKCGSCYYRTVCYGCPAHSDAIGDDDCPLYRAR